MATRNPPYTPKKPEFFPPKEEGSDSVVLERQTLQVQPPPMFQVVLLNDDFTPMEFVIDVLQELFGKDREEATRIMPHLWRVLARRCQYQGRTSAHGRPTCRSSAASGERTG